MAKTWFIEGGSGPCGFQSKAFSTYDAAEIAAKKRAASQQVDVNIYESIAMAKAVVPAIEVVKIEA